MYYVISAKDCIFLRMPRRESSTKNLELFRFEFLVWKKVMFLVCMIDVSEQKSICRRTFVNSFLFLNQTFFYECADVFFKISNKWEINIDYFLKICRTHHYNVFIVIHVLFFGFPNCNSDGIVKVTRRYEPYGRRIAENC